MSERLTAGVQYGDLEGTAAADEVLEQNLAAFMEEYDLYDRSKEMVVGVEMWLGEHHGGTKLPAPQITAIVAGVTSFEEADKLLKSGRQPTLRKVEVKLTLEQFFGFYKRFAITLTRSGLGLKDREVDIEE